MFRRLAAVMVGVWVLLALPTVPGLLAAGRQAPATRGSSPSVPPAATPDAIPPRAFLDKYCVGCHNARLKTAGLLLDQIDTAHVAPRAETWEKVLHKIRGKAMPPAGLPQPPATAAAQFGTWLETELASAAEAHPNVGRTFAIHRLNRAEYQNAIHDLLTLDIDAASLLPSDDSAFGFDNIADILKVSPDLLDSYLAAANKISRLAVGDSAVSLGSATYPVSKLTLQQDRMSDDLPFGSRGGIAVTHYFPYDGEYVLKVRMVGISNPPATLQIHVDGAKAAESATPGRAREAPPDEGAVNVRISLEAGPHLVGASLVSRTLAGESRFPQFYPWANTAATGVAVGGVDYLKVGSIDVTGPFNPQGPGDTPSRRRIFVCQPVASSSEEACARQILTPLARRAFRRHVGAADVQPLLAMFTEARREGTFEAAIQIAIERLLVDPRFLFRIEEPPDGAPGSLAKVSGVELASRLSFFLWSSLPDEALLQAAERGELTNPSGLERQVRRMLADRRSRALVSNFAAEWLYLRNIKGVTPDSFSFPDWDDDLRAALGTETALFLDSQFREDRPVTELLTAKYTFLNERLARHYGIPNVYGSRFRRVQLPDDRRAGLLGQGSILLVTSQPNRTSPVLRGKWLLENFLGSPPPPPPPNVPDLPPAARGADDQPTSIRERMEQHRKNPVCAGCHAAMDPLGFSLENYDAIGAWRRTSDGHPVDASGALPDGTRFEGPGGLRSILTDRREEFVMTFTEKLMTYALGRGVEYYDMPTIRAMVRRSAAGEYRWSSLILEITKSRPFQMRMAVRQP